MVIVVWRDQVINTKELSHCGYKRRFLELLCEHQKLKANTVDLREIGKSYFPCLILDKKHWVVTEADKLWTVERRGMEHLKKADAPALSST